jgi:aryl-alcohol dehydrogenase-like predicted oxidoreductase
MGVRGFATAEGTASYRKRLGARAGKGHFRAWRGLSVSSLGIGTHLGLDDEATDHAYEDSVRRALELGFNMVDTAINYRHQRSERSIGAALRSLLSDGTIAREEVVLTTKGGFIAFDGNKPANPVAYFTETYVRPGVLSLADVVAGQHCMTPRYLSDQLDRSRANLGVDTVDVYYLHNPETQLQGVERPVFATRMRAAFEFLESAVGDGRIRCYGTATWNGYREPPTARDYLSLSELVGLARDVAGDRHHFAMIQLPYNLRMTEALTLPNQTVDEAPLPVVQAAAHLGVYVTASASMLRGQLAKNLPAELGQVLGGLSTDAQRALQFVRSTPGVGTALCGMQRVAHVEENAVLVKLPPAGSLFTRG